MILGLSARYLLEQRRQVLIICDEVDALKCECFVLNRYRIVVDGRGRFISCCKIILSIRKVALKVAFLLIM